MKPGPYGEGPDVGINPELYFKYADRRHSSPRTYANFLQELPGQDAAAAAAAAAASAGEQATGQATAAASAATEVFYLA